MPATAVAMELIALIEQIDNLLPQTQCRECGHPGCRPYAEAIANGEPINRCPPGGDSTIVALAQFLQRPVLPLEGNARDRKSTRLNSSHVKTSYAVFCV